MYQTPALEALEAWRKAGRRLAETDPDSSEYEELVAVCLRAQRLYQAAVGQAAGDHRADIERDTELATPDPDDEAEYDASGLTGAMLQGRG